MIFLRTPDESDIDLILKWENNPENWTYSDTNEPYSRSDIENLIIELAKGGSAQKRYLICSRGEINPVGTIDLFEIDNIRGEASVGVLIESKNNRRRGYASSALMLLEALCHEFQIQTLKANVHPWDEASLQLFDKAGFKTVDVKQDLVKFEKWLKK